MAKAGDVTVHSLVAERSRLTKIKADAAEVEARKLAGELVPAADIEAAWLAVAGAVRSRLLAIPTQDRAAHCRAEDAGRSAGVAAEGNQCCARRHRRHAGNLICRRPCAGSLARDAGRVCATTDADGVAMGRP